MALAIVQFLLSLPVAAFIGALVWTRPGPNQRRRRAIIAWSAAALLLVAVAIMIGGGILEHFYETPELHESQWGSGWEFLAMLLALPMVLLSVAMFGVAFTTDEPMMSRVLVSVGAAIAIGVPLYRALTWMTLVQLEQRL